MADNYFLDATQGVDVARKDAAYHALRQTYGPAAGDPQAQSQLQTTALAGQDAQRMGALRSAMTLKGVAEKGGDVGAAFDSIVAPNAAQFGIDETHVAPLRQALVNNPGHINDIINGLRGPTAVSGAPITLQDDNGNLVTGVHDKYGNFIPVGQPGQAAATAVQGQERVGIAQGGLTEKSRHNVVTEGIGQQNANTAAASVGLRANNSEYGLPDTTGGSTAPNAAPGAQTPGTSPSATPAAGAAPHLTPKRRDEAIRSAANLDAIATSDDFTIQNMDAALKQIGPFSAGTASLAHYIGGTQAKDLKENLSQAEAAIVNNWIAQQKATSANGSTGLGRVLQNEIELAKKRFASLDTAQSPQQLARHINMARNQLLLSQRNIENAYKQQYGIDYKSFSQPAAADTSKMSDEDLLSHYGPKK